VKKPVEIYGVEYCRVTSGGILEKKKTIKGNWVTKNVEKTSIKNNEANIIRFNILLGWL